MMLITRKKHDKTSYTDSNKVEMGAIAIDDY